MVTVWRVLPFLIAFVGLTTPVEAMQSRTKSKGKAIAKLGIVADSAAAYTEKSTESESVAQFGRGTKVVVLSASKSWVRILLADDTEPYLPASKVVVSEDITLKGALARIRFFEKMKEKNPQDESTYDAQAAPWIRLAVKELSKQPSMRLPDLQEAPSDETQADPQLVITNDTGANLSIYMAGPTARSVTVRTGREQTLTLPAGSYRVSASVDRPNVTPLSSTWDLKQGYVHKIRLYISRTRGLRFP